MSEFADKVRGLSVSRGRSKPRVAYGRDENTGVAWKATTNPETKSTITEHADGRQGAKVRPKAVGVILPSKKG